MAKLSRVFDVQIALGTQSITEHTFDLALAVTDNASIGLTRSNRIMTITDADELLDAGANSVDPIYKLAQAWFSQTPHISQLTIGFWDTVGDPSPAEGDPIPPESLTDALAANTTAAPVYLYGLLIESREESDIKEAAAWAESAGRLFVTASNAPEIVTDDDGDVASFLAGENYLRTALCFTTHADDEYPDAALMSNRFTFYPGSETWNAVQLSGVASDDLTETQYQYAAGKNATTFENFRNLAMTQGGKVAGDEWIDTIRFRDWLVEEIKVAEVGLLVRYTNAHGKIPYTDAGIQLIVNALRGVLNLGVTRGGIAPIELDANGDPIPSYLVSYPLAADVPVNDKANRVLKDIKFSARLAGAIHTSEIKGALVLSLN